MVTDEKNDFVWVAAQLKPNALAKAQRNLDRQGFMHFCPMQLETVRGATQFRHQVRQLFPGYCFVEMSPASGDVRKLNATHGISRLVSFGADQISTIPTPLIVALKSRCDDKDYFMEPASLVVGHEVRISSGAFAKFVGTVEAISKSDRLRILFDFIGQKSYADISQQNLEKL
ncbi:transcriptional activator RfaH [Alphaproteobacteria bacterium]|nr:transcriptional activator RfaH [Alphaproteobacteria bacterium]